MSYDVKPNKKGVGMWDLGEVSRDERKNSLCVKCHDMQTNVD